jgi:3-dehydroquinate dehydratase / shikimate dehydrogenase
MTLVCVPIMVHDVQQALADARAAREGGADLVEFRVDEFFTGDGAEHADDESGDEIREITNLVDQSPLPCIVTCRITSEGGGYTGGEDARISLYEHLGTAGSTRALYLDIELDSLHRSANLRQKVRLAVQHPAQLRPDVSTTLIVSMHDFQTRPADLLRKLRIMGDEPAAGVLKVAWRARNLHDAMELLDLPAQMQKPTIALGMGEFGTLSRILAPKSGGFLTFASLRASAATAPGQPTLRELLDDYRFRSIRPATKVYGVVGYPVGHSRSPLVHNAVFSMTGADAVYVPLPIAAYEQEADATYASFRATMLELLEHPRLDFAGCSVTMPHKEHAARLAREQGWTCDPIVTKLGAANTLTIRREGSRAVGVHASNTDVPAIDVAMRTMLPELAGRHVAVLGAGGAAKAAAYAMASAGASVEVLARDLSRAEALAEGIRVLGTREKPWVVVGKSLADMDPSRVDAMIQCTPVGMAGTARAGESLLTEECVRTATAHPVLFETVYNPLETPMLCLARAHGWRTIDGATMFIEQAALQAQAWLTVPHDMQMVRACITSKVRSTLLENA